MPNQRADQSPVDRDVYHDPEIEGPGLVDGLRFLYRRRMRFLMLALMFLCIGILAFLLYYFTSTRKVSATVALRFAGIDRQEYPSGAKFSVEDFRNPDALAKALADAGIASETVKPLDLATHLYVTPVIPPDVQGRWKKQEREGQKKEEYVPTEYKLEIDLGGLSKSQRLRLFDAVIARYREAVKDTQELALGFSPTWDTSYEKLADAYDFWDLPELFGGYYRMLSGRIGSAINESLQNRDPKFQLAFRSVARELNTWHITRLLALEATTYQGKLVKDRDLMIQRVQYRIEDLDIQIRQKSQESAEATHLLGVIEQPRAVLAGQLSNKEGTQMIDASAMDKLIKSDYVGPVVQRISRLQGEIQELEAEKARLQKQLSWLPKSANLKVSEIPPSQRDLIHSLSSELKEITQNYNRLLDEFLASTVTSKVLVTEGPVVSRGIFPPSMAFPVIVLLSLLLAILYLAVEHLFRQARDRETRQAASGE